MAVFCPSDVNLLLKSLRLLAPPTLHLYSYLQTGPNSLVQVPGPPTTTPYVAATSTNLASAPLATTPLATTSLASATLPTTPLAPASLASATQLAPQVAQQAVFASPAPTIAPQQVVVQQGGQQVLATSMGALGAGLGGQLSAQLGAQLGGQLSAQLGAQLGSQLGGQLVTLPNGQQAIMRAQPQMMQLAPQPVQQQFMQVRILNSTQLTCF